MKLLIASDLHGSTPCCEALLSRFEAEGADRLLFLGDLLYHGPRNDLPDGYRPKGVIPLLNGVKDKLLCVRGNCDFVLLNPGSVTLPKGGNPKTYMTYEKGVFTLKTLEGQTLSELVL